MLSALLAAGCVQQHEGAQGSDTATNWLRACSKQRDCGGGHSCIDHLCTQACALSGASDCSALNALAVCEPGADDASARCDLPCSGDQVCADFRQGYACTEGLCRPRAKAATLPAGEPAQKPTRSGTLTLLPAEGPLLLSGRDRVARSPVVEARGDGWRVVWATDPAVPGPGNVPMEPTIDVADIAADGTVSTRGMVHETVGPAGPTLVQGGPGQVAYLQTEGLTGGKCQLRIIATDVPELRDAFDFECGGGRAIAPVPETEDWLVAYSDGGLSPDLEIGRYRPERGDWLAGAWDLGTRLPGGGLSFAAFAGDAWLALSSEKGAMYLRVSGLATPAAADPELPLPAPILGSQPAQYQVFAETPGGALVFYGDGSSLQSVLVQGNKASEASVAPSRMASGASGWKTMGALRVPERGRTFVCYQGLFAASDKVAIVAVDDRGRRVGEPIAISDEAVYMVSCSLAWSDDMLLATWNNFRTARPNVSEYSTVSARIIAMP